MRRFRWVTVAVGVLLIVSSLYIAPLLAANEAKRAARQGTAAAISAAQAKQDTQQTQKAIDSILKTQRGVESLLQFVASVQSGDQARRSAAVARWYVLEFQSICAAVGCRQVHPPPSLP